MNQLWISTAIHRPCWGQHAIDNRGHCLLEQGFCVPRIVIPGTFRYIKEFKTWKVKKCSELGFGRCFCLLDSCWILGGDSWSFFLFQRHSHLHSGVLSSLAGSHLQPAGTRRRVWDAVVLPRGRGSSGTSVSQIVPEQILVLENLLKLDDWSRIPNLFHGFSWEIMGKQVSFHILQKWSPHRQYIAPRPPRRERPGGRHRRWHSDRDDGLPASAARAALRAVEAWDHVRLTSRWFTNKDLTRHGDFGWFKLKLVLKNGLTSFKTF